MHYSSHTTLPFPSVAGDAYETTNYRLHCYLMSSTPALEFKHNSTHLLAREGYGLEAVNRALK